MSRVDITALLSEGGVDAVDRLLPLVYPVLQALAQQHLASERPGHTLDTSALVHEAYLRLVAQDTQWENRSHFYGIASLAMRRILVDYANKRRAQKRGGGVRAITFHDGDIAHETRTDDLLALDEALTRLAQLSPRSARVVEMRFFGGLQSDEIAEILGVSQATVGRDWRFARAWLTRALSQDVLPPE